MFEGWLIKEGTPLGKRFGNFRRASFVPREARRSKGEGKVFDKFPLPLPRHKDDAFFVKHDALAVFLRFNPRCTPPPLFFIDCSASNVLLCTSWIRRGCCEELLRRRNYIIIIFRSFPIFWKFLNRVVYRSSTINICSMENMVDGEILFTFCPPLHCPFYYHSFCFPRSINCSSIRNVSPSFPPL